MIFKNIYNKYWLLMVKFAHRHTNDWETAKDISQEVFISLSIHFKDIECESSARAYLYKCVKNRCLNLIKRNKWIDGKEEELFRVDDFPEDLEVEIELLSAISRLIEKLPPKRREIFKLLYFDGKKNQEVADMLHLSIATVKSQRSEAVIAIRRELKQDSR